MPLDKELLDILACPDCKGGLKPTPEEDGLICEACRLVYPVKEDIPILLPDEADPYIPSSDPPPSPDANHE